MVARHRPGDTGRVDIERDRALVERFQAGDPSAFATLYSLYQPRLVRYCQQRLHDRQEAEDAAQEAFVRAWRALPRLTGQQRFYPWLNVIATNLCTDRQRRRWRSVPMATNEVSAATHRLDDGPDIEEQVSTAADVGLALEALGHLSADNRRLLELREQAEWSARRIAEHEGVTVAMVETRLWRARKALREQFHRLDEGRGVLGGFALGAGVALRRWKARLLVRSGTWASTPGLRNVLVAAVVTGAVAVSVTAVPIASIGSSTSQPATALTKSNSIKSSNDTSTDAAVVAWGPPRNAPTTPPGTATSNSTIGISGAGTGSTETLAASVTPIPAPIAAPPVTVSLPALPSVTVSLPALPSVTVALPALPSVTVALPALPSVTVALPALPSVTVPAVTGTLPGEPSDTKPRITMSPPSSLSVVGSPITVPLTVLTSGR